MTIHDVSPWSVVRGRAAFLLRSTFRSAERIIVHHKANQTDLVKRYELPEKEVRVIPHGSFVGLSGDESGKRESRKLLGLPEEGRFILFFGEIRPEKGLINLVRAMSELRGDVPDSYLVIAGRPRHMDMDECMSEISKLDLADAIIARLHYIDDDLVNAYFSMADVVALPYVDITQSGILFEAMTAGRPVVATDVGGLGPTVREAEVGLVVPPGAPVPLADALKTILNDEQLAAKMSENGRRAALGAFSWSQCADSTLTVYRELVPKEEEKLDTSRLSDG
jgi:glycosyltransferase involved in cell wall biosynthesis